MLHENESARRKRDRRRRQLRHASCYRQSSDICAGMAQCPKRSICWTSWPAAMERPNSANAASTRPAAWKTRVCAGAGAAIGQYHPVTWHKLIDGVFVPDGGAGPVVVDSAGHMFGGFAKTDGQLYGSIWSRAADVKANGRDENKDNNCWMYAMGRGEQFMPRNLGLLGLHANAGITFNLEAMRTMYPAVRPARFRATAGVAEAHGFALCPDGRKLADLWVLVDGQLKLSRTHLRPQDGAVNVDVELGRRIGSLRWFRPTAATASITIGWFSAIRCWKWFWQRTRKQRQTERTRDDERSRSGPAAAVVGRQRDNG